MAEPTFDVTSFGEMLVRLSVPSGERLESAGRFDVHPAGAEANVITLLARLGCKASWVGALPANPMGRLAVNALRTAGVSTGGILWRERGRMGTYYVEFGEPPRGIQVTYDRAGSCAAGVQPGEMDWDTLLDTRILHLTGITPALSDSCGEIVREAVKRAKQRGILVSLDVNYRQKLWTEEAARQMLLPLLRQVDLLFCSQADAARLFGCRGAKQEIADQLLDLTKVPRLVVSFGEEGVMGREAGTWKHEPACPTQIIDRLGAGDALAAGVLYGLLKGDFHAGLRYGVVLAAMALSQKGDMLITNEGELLALSKQSASLTR